MIARPQSEPAEAFRRLSDLLGGAAADEAVLTETTNGGPRRQIFTEGKR